MQTPDRMTHLPAASALGRVGAMRRSIVPLAAAAALAAGCGGSEDDKAAPASPKKPAAAAGSPLLGEYVQRVRIKDLSSDDDAGSAGVYRMTLGADSYESFTPKGPGIAGPGRPDGDRRYVFDADYRRECAAPAAYELAEAGGKLEFRPVAKDPCEVRRAALTIAPWRRR